MESKPGASYTTNGHTIFIYNPTMVSKNEQNWLLIEHNNY